MNKKRIINLSNIRTKDAMKFFQLIIYTISIVAFLAAIEYFSAKSSLSVTVINSPLGYCMDTVKNFYKTNNLEIPKSLIEDDKLTKLFTEETSFVDDNYIFETGSTSSYDLITAIKQGQNIGMLTWYIEQLEAQIGKYHYRKFCDVWISRGEFYQEDKFSDILKYIKTKLTPQEYFIFLTALLFSREIENTIWIKNNGDIDLKDIVIIIPSPLSKITDSRGNNILATRIISTDVHKIKKMPDNVEIYLPNLKKNHIFDLCITTRENQIENNELFYSFKEEKCINKLRMLVTGIIIFSIMCVLGLFFKGHHENS